MSSSKLEQIKQLYSDEELLIADGFDDAIIGVDDENVRVVYDVFKIISILIQDGMSTDEAFEFYQYNILGAYVGENTPLFVKLIA
jgi:hypothetical protein